MISTLDIAWLGGLIEGEGCFTDSRGSIAIQLQMTDEDTVKRAAAIFGVKPRAPWKQRKEGYKLVYPIYVLGTRAIGWMLTLYKFLGERRQKRIREILTRWRGMKYAPRAPRGQRYMAVCHPDKPRMGDMLCGTCYMRRWRERTGRGGSYYRNRAKAALACT